MSKRARTSDHGSERRKSQKTQLAARAGNPVVASSPALAGNTVVAKPSLMEKIRQTKDKCQEKRIFAQAVLLPGEDPASVHRKIGSSVRQIPFKDWTICMRHPTEGLGKKRILVRGTIAGLQCDGLEEYSWEILGIELDKHALKQITSDNKLPGEMVTRCPCSSNAVDFFLKLGHKKDGEFKRHGFLIETTTGIEVRIMQCQPVAGAGFEQLSEKPCPWLVELSGTCEANVELTEVITRNIRRLLEDKDFAGVVKVVIP